LDSRANLKYKLQLSKNSDDQEQVSRLGAEIKKGNNNLYRHKANMKRSMRVYVRDGWFEKRSDDIIRYQLSKEQADMGCEESPAVLETVPAHRLPFISKLYPEAGQKSSMQTLIEVGFDFCTVQHNVEMTAIFKADIAKFQATKLAKLTERDNHRQRLYE